MISRQTFLWYAFHFIFIFSPSSIPFQTIGRQLEIVINTTSGILIGTLVIWLRDESYPTPCTGSKYS